MKLSMVDTHAHLDMAQFDKDRAEVIGRALEAGVDTIISVGIDLSSSRRAIELAERYPQVLATVGFHPHEAAGVKEADVEKLAELARNSRVVAIGEVGLDFYRNRSPRQAQLRALEWQLELAEELNLPVIVHCRQADKDMLTMLHGWVAGHRRQDGQPRGVIHCFSGDNEIAQQYLDLGFFISFGAYIGYPTSRHICNVVKNIPQGRLLVETDSPFLPPQHRRGQRNEPAYLPLTVEILAGIRGVTAEMVAVETTQNSRCLFRYKGLE